MANIQSPVTELPPNCRSAADRMTQELAAEERFAELTENSRRKLTELEQAISKESKEKVALVAYRV